MTAMARTVNKDNKTPRIVVIQGNPAKNRGF
jgi:hypothetical protein